MNEKFYIGIFGKRNSGKSTLFNAILNQNLSVVSSVEGTTTDLVKKSIEIPGVGACVLIDTPGFDDEGELGKLRVNQAREAIHTVDVALVLTKCDREFYEPSLEALTTELEEFNVAYETLVNPTPQVAYEAILRLFGRVSQRKQIDLTGKLVKAGDSVVLVMPQDNEAPKDRLILPQVQTIRHLLDKGCIVTCIKPEDMKILPEMMRKSPDLVIVDSGVFYKLTEVLMKCRVTSFSILFANLKGDLKYFIDSAKKLEDPIKRILIAEACSHIPNPEGEDIGRVKLPKLLRQKLGDDVVIEFSNSKNFFSNLTTGYGKEYDLIIHCGACMLNRKQMMNRVVEAKKQNIPMTNYGVAIAQLLGILDKVVLP